LIVEDEGIIANDLGRTLQNLGHVVAAVASSGSQALEYASSLKPDLVLMDIRIHGDMDGIETAEQIRRQFRTPVVYLTAHTDTATVERAKLTQPFGYIVKPFSSADIRITVDIALERHHLQRELEDHEAWSSAVLRSIGDAVLVADADQVIKFINSAASELMGVTADQVMGKPIADILRVKSDEDRKSAEPSEFSPATLVCCDGREQVVIKSSAPVIKGPGSEEHGTVVILRNVSDLKKTEQALRENNWFLQRSNEHLTQLSHSLSHDLQEPLRTVTCYSAMLARRPEVEGNEQTREYLNYIRDGCERMNELLSSLLEYYRAAATGQTRPVTVDSNRCLNEALQNLATAIRDSEAIICWAALPPVHCHPTALTQVFQNLIANAIKYRSEQRPKIDIEVEQHGADCLFTIADNGIGFEHTQAEDIFGLFWRARGSERPGAGVGLALCRRLIDQYKGKIWAESVPGQGSRFRFALPAAAVSE
jgi:hypothetical protein